MLMNQKNFKINLFVPEIFFLQVDVSIPEIPPTSLPLIYADSEDNYPHQIARLFQLLHVQVRFQIYE